MSALPISDLFGTSSGRVIQYEAVSFSKSVVALWDGVVDVLVIGGHGSGGAFYGTNLGYLTGASAGETAVAVGIPVLRGDSIAATIGAGGLAATANSGTVRATGNNGNASSVVIGVRTITAQGGRGAQYGLAGTPLNGPAGGSGGSGGDIHVAGGDGGSILATTATQACAGSGAVGILLTPASVRSGGNVNSPGAAGSVSGGAGVNGRGGDSTGANGYPGGGGSGGPGQPASGIYSLPGPNAVGIIGGGSPQSVAVMAGRWGLDVFGGGAYSNVSGGYAAGPGGGGAGVLNGTVDFADAGIFAGPGGLIVNSNTARIAGKFGPGGSVIVNAAGGSAVSGAGASGLVVLVFREA